jgi:hypothetical protein
MWLDGKKQASATVSDADLPFSRWFCTGHTCNPTVHGYPNVKLIRPPDNSAFIHIDCNLVSFIALFNTVLPDATMSALTLNPYDLLMFKEDEFFVPVLQAAAFKPAWARGSNLPVIGTGVF